MDCGLLCTLLILANTTYEGWALRVDLHVCTTVTFTNDCTIWRAFRLAYKLSSDLANRDDC